MAKTTTVYYNYYNLLNSFDIQSFDSVPVESMNAKGGYNCSSRPELLDLRVSLV